MKPLLYIITSILLIMFFAFSPSGQVFAQTQGASWSQCTDGRAIVRCETYDCPLGDTNKDGRCTLTDTNARLADARNDSFCANPISGCGQVQYYPGGSAESCLARVEQKIANCELYSVATPNFTPTPATPTATPVAGVASACVSLTATPQTGAPPLSVDLVANATDSRGAIKEYEFEITKPTGTPPGVVTQSSGRLRQVFTEAGEYRIRVSAVDSRDARITSAACATTVTVGATTTKGGEELPKTGPSDTILVAIAVLALGAVGFYIYEKHRFI